MKGATLLLLIIVAIVIFLVFFKKTRRLDGFCGGSGSSGGCQSSLSNGSSGCNSDEVRVSGVCRKTCFQGNYNPGTKSCY